MSEGFSFILSFWSLKSQRVFQQKSKVWFYMFITILVLNKILKIFRSTTIFFNILSKSFWFLRFKYTIWEQVWSPQNTFFKGPPRTTPYFSNVSIYSYVWKKYHCTMKSYLSLWWNVLCTDEVKIGLFSNGSGKKILKRPENKGLGPKYTTKTVKRESGNIMVGACFSYRALFTYFWIRWRPLNSAKYKAFLCWGWNALEVDVLIKLWSKAYFDNCDNCDPGQHNHSILIRFVDRS